MIGLACWLPAPAALLAGVLDCWLAGRLASLLALSTTAKSVRDMLEEDRLQRTGAAIMRYHKRQQMGLQ